MTVHVWRVRFDTVLQSSSDGEPFEAVTEGQESLLVTAEGSINAIAAQLAATYGEDTRIFIRGAEWIGPAELPTQKDFTAQLFPGMMPNEN
jgi:hypothetical protein